MLRFEKFVCRFPLMKLVDGNLKFVFFLFFFSLASRLFFGCLQLRIQTAFETLPFIRYVCVCVRRCIYTESTHSGGREEQAEEGEGEEDEVGGMGSWKMGIDLSH